MKVKVGVFGRLTQYTGKNNLEVEMLEGTTVRDLLEQLGIPEGLGFSILLNSQHATTANALQDGDEVHLIPMSAGG